MRAAVKPILALLRRELVYWLPLLLLAGAVAAHIVIPSVFERLSLFAFDIYQRADPRKASTDPPVVIVDIDEKSLHEVGQWPWPRTILAKLVDRLNAAGAAVISFDALFSEPDRTSPELLLKLLESEGVSEAGAQKLLATMPDPDSRFAAAMAKAPVVVGFELAGSGGRPQTAVKAGFAVVGARNENPWRFVDRFPAAVSALPMFLKSVSGNGFVNEPSDWDNVVRRVPMVLRLGNRPVPSLAAETLRVGFGGHGYIARYAGAQADRSFGENTGLNAIEIPVPAAHTALRIPVDSSGEVAIHYAPRDLHQYISAADILAGRFNPKRIADHIVLIGSSAAGLNDLKATPISPDMPGVEIHAQLIDQILQHDFLFRPDWGPGAEILFSCFVGLLLILAIPRFGALPGALLAGAAMIGAAAASWFAFKDGQVLLDPVYPMTVVAEIYLFSTLLNYRLTERRQREIRQAFSLYLSPHYVAELAKNPDKLQLGGEIRLMTIMFCDIRGFTTLSEGLTSHDLGQLINEFLTPMTEIIMDHKGTIDKYIGDCIMAFWNAPLDDPDHAKNAVAAAQGMRQRLVELNEAWAAAGRKTLHVGIGINTGECSVGNFGSNQKFNYSLLGDPVNLSSRLEGLTKLYGVDLIIGEETAKRLDDPGLVELDLVAVKGKLQAVRIYTLPPHLPEAQRFLESHAKVLAAYRHRDWKAALGWMDDPVLAESEMAPVYDVFRERIAQMQAEPPPQDWDGVYVAHEK
ncbi:MAG TPA: adenylate/guanylate cyclase domain-containing protein [Stellaceae bacterium]|nr:adenylate/guanylate cyclase domain-containing protein [Stellaceae bacterium]